ncbi:hypothetical protein B0I35DRAFT_446136 [Stachybotrys elegans]|uniref:Uncharacterized protein n=1 Tax=Stachybotrys elegans TaxID=80388 RepID=A0A8K0SGS5_9HYPO|nr:hypothetical protein B0I35DRAFT_446136 [Stachybotrys elegans]
MTCCPSNPRVTHNFGPLPQVQQEPPRPPPTHQVENGRLVRRRGFLGRQGYRMAAIARNPRLITLRELVTLLFIVYCGWRFMPFASETRALFEAATTSMYQQTGIFGCLRFYLRVIVHMLQRWAGECLAWVPILAVLVFVTESAGIGRIY